MDLMTRRRALLARVQSGGGRLPSAYQEVEYLESSGTQYINTNYYVQSEKIQIIADVVAIVSESEKDLIGNQDLVSNRFVFGTFTRKFFAYAKQGGISEANLYSVAYDATKQRYQIDVLYDLALGIKSMTINNVSWTASHSVGIISSRPVEVLSDGQHSGSFGGQLYAIKMFDGDTSAFDLVPCYRKADSKPGMYDLVSHTFLTNAGTGEFTVGADVN